MKALFKLSIKKPCGENFNDFNPTVQGGFCNSCSKGVIDFTKMKPDEIITYFKDKQQDNVCGRFNGSQLTMYSESSKTSNKLRILSGIVLACLSLFSINTMHAQETKAQPNSSDRNIQEIKDQTSDRNIVVKGNVSESSQPLPGVNVVLEGTTIGTTTDLEGNFEFPEKLKQGDVLLFSFIGMPSQKVVINDATATSKVELKVDMTSDEYVLMGKVAMNKVYKSKKNE